MDREAMTDPLRAAREDCGSVVELARRLVRVPSRGGIDPSGPVLECMSAWLGEHGWACRRLAGPDGVTVALACEVPCVPYSSAQHRRAFRIDPDRRRRHHQGRLPDRDAERSIASWATRT
jgi:hypothetical protein